MTSREEQIQQLQQEWLTNPRWEGIERPYSAEDVVRLRGSVQIEHTLARRGQKDYMNLYKKKISLMRSEH